MKKIIKFFKKNDLYNKDYFDKLIENTIFVNAEYDEMYDLIGCYVEDENKFTIVVPKIKTALDRLICIHEYTHMLFIDDDLEIFPNLMEAMYVNDFIEDKNIKKKILEDTKEQLSKTTEINHKVGKKIKINSIKI